MCFCSENVDFLYLGGHAWLSEGGCAWFGGVWLPGGVRGCWGGMCGCQGVCMVDGGRAWLLGGCAWLVGGHACMVAGGCAWLPGGMRGCWEGCVVAGGCMVAGGMVTGGHVWLGVCVPCDLSHHAFDVTCMLSPHQLRASSYAPAYILVGHVTRMPPPVDRQTPVKT